MHSRTSDAQAPLGIVSSSCQSDGCRHQSKNLPKHHEVLFTGSEVSSGPIELSKVQQDKRKLGTMCHALIAEHIFTPINFDTYTAYPSTVLLLQYSSTISSTFLLLFVQTEETTMFLYKGIGVQSFII
jgi:hypothetical protein